MRSGAKIYLQTKINIIKHKDTKDRMGGEREPWFTESVHFYGENTPIKAEFKYQCDVNH